MPRPLMIRDSKSLERCALEEKWSQFLEQWNTGAEDKLGGYQ